MSSFSSFKVVQGHECEGELSLPSKITYFGLILLLIGVVCLVVGEVNLGNVKQVEVGTHEYLVWSYALNLTRGETYRVDISGGSWGAAFASGGYTSPQPLNVTITSPGGGITSLQAFYWSEPSSSPNYRVGTPPAIVSVTYLNVDDASLSVDSSSAEIVFTVRQSGTYIVSVPQNGGRFYTSKEAPDYIAFYQYVTANRETYSFLASGGGTAGTLGGVALIVGLFRRPGPKRKRTVQ
jgi:hypothetical protein